MAQSATISDTTAKATADGEENENFQDCDMTEKLVEAAKSAAENEIVCLHPLPEIKWQLNAGYAFDKHWNKATENNELTHESIVFIISFLGNTTAGKSYICKHFLNNNETKPWSGEESDLSSSTTGNVNCFECEKMVEGMSKTLLLDFEGEKGTCNPLMLRIRQYLSHKAPSYSLKRLLGERSKAVSEYFPKLAYILSNVVVYIGTEDIVCSEYLTHCCEFAQRANEGVSQVVYQPVLIIIENTSSLAKKFGIDEVTSEFFAIHQQNEKLKELKKYFSEIYCMRLPHADQTQKVKGKHIIGEVVFNEQIAQLKQKFLDIYKKSQERLMTHPQWLFLLDQVLEIVSRGKSVSIHNLLCAVTDTSEEYECIARRLFVYLYSTKVVHSPKWYKHCRRFAMKLLARSLAVKFLKQEEIISERVIRENCKEKLYALWKILDEFIPCEALYRNHLALGTSSPVPCNQHKGAHPNHRISEVSTNWVGSFFGHLLAVSWEGNFVTSETDESSESALNEFTVMTFDYIKILKESREARYQSFIKLLEEYQFDEKTIGALPARRCPCCLERRRSGRFPIRWIMRYERIPFCRLCTNEIDTLSWSKTRQTSVNSNKQQSNDNCVICNIGKRDHCLIPCGQRGFCFNCATKIQTESKVCPRCNEKVEGILKQQEW